MREATRLAAPAPLLPPLQVRVLPALLREVRVPLQAEVTVAPALLRQAVPKGEAKVTDDRYFDCIDVVALASKITGFRTVLVIAAST